MSIRPKGVGPHLLPGGPCLAHAAQNLDRKGRAAPGPAAGPPGRGGSVWAGCCHWFQNEPSCVTAGTLGVAMRLSWAFSPPFRRKFLVHSFIPSLIRQIRTAGLLCSRLCAGPTHAGEKARPCPRGVFILVGQRNRRRPAHPAVPFAHDASYSPEGKGQRAQRATRGRWLSLGQRVGCPRIRCVPARASPVERAQCHCSWGKIACVKSTPTSVGCARNSLLPP